MFIFAGLMDDVEVGGVEKVQQKYSNSGDNINGQRGNGPERRAERRAEKRVTTTKLYQTIYVGMLFTNLATACRRALNDDRVMGERC